MKAIFTYPNNASDHYIDPDYVGDDTVGFQKRVKDLKDGNYKPWEGNIPTASVDQLMEDFSKFNGATWLENDGGNNTIFDFWQNPMPKATLELIENDVTSATARDQVDSLFEFGTTHGLYTNQPVTLSNFDGSLATLNGNTYYVDKIDSDTIKLKDTTNNNNIEFYDIENHDILSASAVHQTVSQVSFTNQDFQTGWKVELTGFNNDWAQFNDQELYVNRIDAQTIELALDSNLTQKIQFYKKKNPTMTLGTARHLENATLTFASPHGFSDGDDIFLNDIVNYNGSYGAQTAAPNLLPGYGENYPYYTKVLNSTQLELSLNQNLTQIISFYNLANGYISSYRPKKYASEGYLTGQVLVGNTLLSGDVNTISDGDNITFDNISETTDNAWHDLLEDNSFYVGDTSGNDFQIYTDQSRTQLAAMPYHRASNSDMTATVSGDVVMTYGNIGQTYRNYLGLEENMPINIDDFDGTLAQLNGNDYYVQNLDKNAQTFNISTDQAGNDIVNFAPTETDVDIDRITLNSDNTITWSMPSRTPRLPDATEITLSNQVATPGAPRVQTSNIGAESIDWISDTRLAVLFANNLKFYDYDQDAQTITEDTNYNFTTTDANVMRISKDKKTIVCYEADNNNLQDTIYIITNTTGSTWTIDTQTITTDITDFEGFRSLYQVALSDDGLTMVLGNPYWNHPGYTQLTGRAYILRRASRSNNFDFGSLTYEFSDPNSSTQGTVRAGRYGNHVFISGNGQYVIIGSWDQTNYEPFSILESGSPATFALDTTNPFPQQDSLRYIWYQSSVDSGWLPGLRLNYDGTVAVTYRYNTANTTYEKMIVLGRADTSSAWTNKNVFPLGNIHINDGEYIQTGSAFGSTLSGQLWKYDDTNKKYSNVVDTNSLYRQGVKTTNSSGIESLKGGQRIKAMRGSGSTSDYYVLFGQSVDRSPGSSGNISITDYTTEQSQLFYYLTNDYNSGAGIYYLDYINTTGGKNHFRLKTDFDLTQDASWAELDNLSSGDIDFAHNDTFAYYWEYDIGVNYTPSTTGLVVEHDPDLTNHPAHILIASPGVNPSQQNFVENYTASGPNELVALKLEDCTQGKINEIYEPPTPNIIAQFTPLTGATTGHVTEVVDLPPNVIPLIGPLSDSTQGTITIHAGQNNRYRVASVDIETFGNYTYMQRTGASTYVPNPIIQEDRYQSAGYDAPWTDPPHWPDITLTADSEGYLNGGISFDPEFPGQLRGPQEVMFEVTTEDDTYTPPATPPAEAADNWDLDDAWLDASYVGGSGKKEWPDHVTPSSATITLNTPTIVNKSQNGIKYARKSSFTKWTLEVEYPPMTKNDFMTFHGAAQAAQGQAIPFLFRLNSQNGDNILWKDFNKNADGTTRPRFKEDMSPVSTVLLAEGFRSNLPNAFCRGEVISLIGPNDNGDLHTVLTDTTSNAYGEAKIRLTYPVKGQNYKGNEIYKQPNACVVTLADDNFTYTTDANGFYLVSVAFELDNYK